MTTYEVTSPDGKTYEVTPPEGTSQEEVMKYVQNMHQPQETKPRDYTGQDVINSAKGVAEGLAHVVMHPIDTAENIGNTIKGAIQSIPGATVSPGDDKRAYAQTLVKHYTDRYGSLEKAHNTFGEDPVGMLLDLSGATGLTGAALKAGGLGKTANVVNAVSRATDPILQTGKAIGTVADKVGKPVIAGVLGQTTGSGPAVIEKAIDTGLGDSSFQKAKTGAVDDLGVVEKYQEAYQKMADARSQAYRDKLTNVKNSNVDIDITPVRQRLDKKLSDFGVGAKPDGTLDFSRSPLRGDDKAMADVSKVVDFLKEQGTKQGDLTAIGLDNLKKTLSNIYSENGSARALIADVKGTLDKTISNKVPEYAEMTKGYAKDTAIMDETRNALLSKDQSKVDTVLRKILMGVREEKGLRRNLMDDLSKYSEEDLQSLAAGRISAPWVTQRLSSLASSGVGIAGGVSVAPQLLALIPMASPRMAATASQLLGSTARATKYIASKTPRVVYQASLEVNQSDKSIQK